MLSGANKAKTTLGKENKMNETFTCCICGKVCEGYGNNAEPVKEGICCDKCNEEVVIPKRLEELFGTSNK